MQPSREPPGDILADRLTQWQNRSKLPEKDGGKGDQKRGPNEPFLRGGSNKKKTHTSGEAPKGGEKTNKYEMGGAKKKRVLSESCQWGEGEKKWS